jgi:hypothetical protein
MIPMNKLVPFIATTAALFSVTAFADDSMKSSSQSTMQPTFSSLDRNADAKLSKEEAQGDRSLAANFSGADTDGDGFLSKTEYSDSLQQSRGSRSTTPPTNAKPVEPPTS